MTVIYNQAKIEISSKQGKLSLTDRHYIEKESVKWELSGCDCLSLKAPLGFCEPPVIKEVEVCYKKQQIHEDASGFSFFIYSEEKTGVVLRIETCIDERVCQYFDYTINFVGWKRVALPYDRGHMNGFPEKGMNRLNIRVLSCKDKAQSQALYFDELMFGVPIPLLNAAIALFPQSPTLNSPSTRKMTPKNPRGRMPVPLKSPPEEIADRQRSDFAMITRAFLELLDELDTPTPQSSETTLDKINEFYQGYEIKVSNGIVTGKFIKDSTAYCKMLKSVAWYYLKEPSEELFEIYFNLLWHLDDQNTEIAWYNGRGAASSLLMMRDALIKYDKLDFAIRFLREKYSFERLYATTSNASYGLAGYRFEDTDNIGMCLPSWLVCVLLARDSGEKVLDMRYFIEYLEDFVLGLAPGLESGYKPDGTSHHHCGFVLPYETVADLSIARVLYMLKGTSFMIKKEKTDWFKEIIETKYMVVNGAYEPYAIKQYRFNPTEAVNIRFLAYFAAAFDDDKIAGMYLSLADTIKSEREGKWYGYFQNKGIRSLPQQEGHKTLTYAAAAFHKREDFTLAVRGYSKYAYGQEIWSREGGRYTAFAYFRGFGFLEQLKGPDENGTNNGLFIDKGFDFTRWPGTTTLKLPLEWFCSQPLRNQDEYSEWLLSDSGFAGGLDCSSNGIFAFSLHGHEKYGLQSLRANKSYHFYDDITICMGSGIKNDISEYFTQTTIFQDYDHKPQRNGDFYIDSSGTAYLILDGQVPMVESGLCQSRDIYDLTDTYGERTTLLINHGFAPRDAAYSYLQLQAADEVSLKATQGALLSGDIKVLRQDEYAHVVRAYNKLSCVLFWRDYEFNCSIIKAVTESCIIMLEEQGDGSIVLSIADPDLRLYNGDSDAYDISRHMTESSIYSKSWCNQESIPSKIQVLLEGEYSLLKETDKLRVVWCDGTRTMLEAVCKDGLSVQGTLRKPEKQ